MSILFLYRPSSSFTKFCVSHTSASIYIMLPSSFLSLIFYNACPSSSFPFYILYLFLYFFFPSSFPTYLSFISFRLISQILPYPQAPQLPFFSRLPSLFPSWEILDVLSQVTYFSHLSSPSSAQIFSHSSPLPALLRGVVPFRSLGPLQSWGSVLHFLSSPSSITVLDHICVLFF